ncbi:hypothetical protein CICLE_v10010646mg [Citrus x clementina]|uniref:Uncharacterized protein n=2 Tax=Citrus TaxID=2706 RepID=V4WJH4_CITCL|nr:hypothetical protein CICLE_v10010646mg [Citrus x clementina]GAY56706.1 hypothetical protein CUMW_173950 [Citrus unshiu]
MATNRAAEMMLQCVFNGNLSLHDMHKERRPYHRDCDCALHKLKGTVCSDAYCSQKRNVSFPNNKKKQSWSDCSLSINSRSPSRSAGRDALQNVEIGIHPTKFVRIKEIINSSG